MRKNLQNYQPPFIFPGSNEENASASWLGSDPSEFWNKQQFTEVWTEMFPEGESLPKTQVISELEMKLAADGKSATVIHQYVMPDFIPKLISRNTYYLVKNDKWEILVLNYGFAPYNEDLPKIIAALE